MFASRHCPVPFCTLTCLERSYITLEVTQCQLLGDTEAEIDNTFLMYDPFLRESKVHHLHRHVKYITVACNAEDHVRLPIRRVKPDFLHIFIWEGVTRTRIVQRKV